jgi:hypothetical protein
MTAAEMVRAMLPASRSVPIPARSAYPRGERETALRSHLLAAAISGKSERTSSRICVVGYEPGAGP